MNMKSSHDNVKPKEGEGAKAGETNASNDGVIVLERGLALKMS